MRVRSRIESYRPASYKEIAMFKFENSVNDLSQYVIANPEVIDSLLNKKFDWDDLVSNANEIGYSISVDDIEDYLTVKFPPDAPELIAKAYVGCNEAGSMRELSADEINAVVGGLTDPVLVTAVVVVAAVATVVVVVSVGVGATIAAGAGVFAVAAVSTSVVASGGHGYYGYSGGYSF